MYASEQRFFKDRQSIEPHTILKKRQSMNAKFATTSIIICALLAPVVGYTADSDLDRSQPMTFVKDSVITTKIKTKLAADHPDSMMHIQVDTDKNSVVWLSGTANSQTAVDQAVAVARSTEGVRSIKNHIRIEMAHP